MNEIKPQRLDLAKLLTGPDGNRLPWNLLEIRSIPLMGSEFDTVMMCLLDQRPYFERQIFWRIHAINTADYAIRPKDPNTYEGGPWIKLFKADPRLEDPQLKYVPGGDGEVYNPPRKFQLLELDQSWIIAERFEIEPLPQNINGKPVTCEWFDQLRKAKEFM